MNESNTTDSNICVSHGTAVTDFLTPNITSGVNSITDLWALARMARDIAGDKVWDALSRIGCHPRPLDNIGYTFEYNGLSGIYFPARAGSGTVRFALPRLSDTDAIPRDRLTDMVNTANSMVTESKFTVMGDGIWIVHERYLSDAENYHSMVMHILENLEYGAGIFHDMCKKISVG